MVEVGGGVPERKRDSSERSKGDGTSTMKCVVWVRYRECQSVSCSIILVL
jgi:hypothetical protein